MPFEFCCSITNKYIMSKLYGPDEGYEIVRSRSTVKKGNKKEVSKPVVQHVSLYKTVRSKISDLICDQELVMSGPPFNPVVNLDELSHTDFVNKANEVMTPFNPEGHPPPGVYSPTMRNLIDRLEVSRTKDPSTYASVVRDSSTRSPSSSVPSYNGSVLSEDRYTSDEVNDIDYKETAVTAEANSPKRALPRTTTSSPKKAVQNATKKMKVSFAPLDMKNSQYAISTVQEASALPRRVGSREVILTERLGDFYTGKKKITSSALNKHVSSEETEEMIELQEYYQRKEQSAINRARMVRGKNSMVESAEDEPLGTGDHVVNDDHITKKRRTPDNHDQTFHGDLSQVDQPREEFKSQPTQELLSDVPPRPITARAIIARQSRIDRTAIRKVVSNTVIASPPIPEIDTGYNSEMFYALVERNEVSQHTVINYEEPPYHDESVLWNEDIGQDVFVLPKKDWDGHTLSDEERLVFNDAQSRYEYLHRHRACFHDAFSIEDIILTIEELPSDLHLYLVMTGSALTNYRWSPQSTFQTDKEKYVAALRRCRRTFTVNFGEIPFSHIRVEHLLLLPKPAIIEYLLFHGVSYHWESW